MNNKYFFIAIGWLFSTLLYAQESPNKIDALGRKQGHWIKLDADKKKIYEGNFIDNIPVGKFTYFYDTGTPWSGTVFSKNGTVAHTQMFDAGGQITGEGKYVKEKKDSLWKFYGRSGKLLATENYVNGVKNGIFIVYYSNGEIAEKKTWKAGVLDGPCIRYFETGQLKYQGQYVNNKVEGKVSFYHPSGKLNVEGIYKNDLKEGPWKYYKEDGALERTDEYKHGLFQGKNDPNVITKEQEEKEKKQFEQFEMPNPYQDR